MSFSAESAVAATADPGRYTANIAPGWDILGNANGGYLLALAARAASANAGGLPPVTVTGHFLAPGRAGPIAIDVHTEREGRSFSTVRATVSDGSRAVLAMLGSFGSTSAPSQQVRRIEAEPPDLPDRNDCVSVEPSDGFPPPFMGKVELRLHPQDASFSTGVPRFRGWFRLRDEEPIDGFGLLVAVDSFPPTVFNAQLPIAWTPTLELTAHVRGEPEPGWLRCQFTTRFISDGFLEEDGEVWDEAGRLVAQSRQLALLPRG